MIDLLGPDGGFVVTMLAGAAVFFVLLGLYLWVEARRVRRRRDGE